MDRISIAIDGPGSSGKSINSEVDLGNENFPAREPVSVQLQQGWNKLSIVVDGDRGEFEAELRCGNKPDFLRTVRASLKPQE